MFQWTPPSDNGGHFWFLKEWVENMNWAALSQSSQAVFPVLAIHADSSGLCFPGEDRIAALSGITEKTAREGLRGLDGFPAYSGFQFYKTGKGKRGRKYQLSLPRAKVDDGQAFPFHRIIVEGGNWAQLLPSAKALYVGMRYFGYFDEYLYHEYQDENFSFCDDEGGVFGDRKCDFCCADYIRLARYAGIHRNQVGKVINNLIEHCLAERIIDDGRELFKVYLRPPKYYKTSCLNEQLMSRRKSK